MVFGTHALARAHAARSAHAHQRSARRRTRRGRAVRRARVARSADRLCARHALVVLERRLRNAGRDPRGGRPSSVERCRSRRRAGAHRDDRDRYGLDVRDARRLGHRLSSARGRSDRRSARLGSRAGAPRRVQRRRGFGSVDRGRHGEVRAHDFTRRHRRRRRARNLAVVVRAADDRGRDGRHRRRAGFVRALRVRLGSASVER